MERETRKFDLTINGETRSVEARDMWGDGKAFDTVEAVALVRFRTGTKLWPQIIRFWFDEKSGTYRPAMTYTHLNRHATRVVAWNDEKYAAKLTNHNSY